MHEFTGREKKILEYLNKSFKNSPTHDLGHSLRVANICVELQKQVGGDRDIVVAAALLHDAGRHKNLRGDEHAKQGAETAKKVLPDFGYSTSEIRQICDAINTHHLLSKEDASTEAKILYDADNIDGTGALGIAKCFMYSGETGGGFEEGVERLEVKMPKRQSLLKFEESKKIAGKRYSFVKQFLKKLKEDLSETSDGQIHRR